MSKIGVIGAARVTLPELLGDEFSTQALDKLDDDALAARIQALDAAWQQSLVHAPDATAQPGPTTEALARGVPVLRALLAARQAETRAEEQIAGVLTDTVRAAVADGAPLRDAVTSAANASSVTTREGVVLHHPPTPDEVEAARTLIEKRYRQMGYVPADQSYAFNAAAVPLVATFDGAVVATASLIGPGARALPLEEVFPEEVAELRAQGMRVAEFGAFASEADLPREVATHAAMSLVDLARVALGHMQTVDVVVVAVHPHHAGFYRRRLGAQVLVQEPRPHPKVEGSPAVLLALGTQGGRTPSLPRDLRLVARIVAATVDGLSSGIAP